MEVLSRITEWQKRRRELQGKTLGFVPTMGALHEGHLTLVRNSKRENDLTVVSIFVNPTQFNDPKDLEKYPRDIERDFELLKAEGVDFIVTPTFGEIYADNYRYKVTEAEFSNELCGKSRPGHFDGVLTVVLKLFNIVTPTRAYFGEKDYQQLQLITDMTKSLFLPIEIVPVPTQREEDGLAMSSRNLLLGTEERAQASHFPTILREAESVSEARRQLESKGIQIDYIEEKMGRRFGAVKIGNVRLIDNVKI